MQTLVIGKTVNLDLLHQQLQAAVPALLDRTGLGPFPRALYSLVQGEGDTWTLSVPDTVDLGVINAVLAAHDATQQTAGQQQATTDGRNLQQLADAYQQALTDLQAGRAQLAAGQTNLADAAWTPLTAAAKAERLRTVLQGTLTELDAVEQRQRNLLLALRVVVRRAGAG